MSSESTPIYVQVLWCLPFLLIDMGFTCWFVTDMWDNTKAQVGHICLFLCLSLGFPRRKGALPPTPVWCCVSKAVLYCELGKRKPHQIVRFKFSKVGVFFSSSWDCMKHSDHIVYLDVFEELNVQKWCVEMCSSKAYLLFWMLFYLVFGALTLYNLRSYILYHR